MSNLKIKKNLLQSYLLNSIQYGHKLNETHKNMFPYISKISNTKDSMFNLVKISKLLKIAGDIVEQKAKKGEKFLFIGTTKVSSLIIRKQAMRCNSSYINTLWVAGTFTNWVIIQKKIEKLNNLEKEEKDNYINCSSKKEIILKKKEIIKLKYLFEGIKTMTSFPDIIILTSPLENMLIIQECNKLGIPIISIIDTNTNPNLVLFPICANDDSKASINLILTILVDRILMGVKSSTNQIL